MTIKNRNKMYKMKHFTMRELVKSPTAQRLGIDNEPTEAIKANLTALVEHILDPLREAMGKIKKSE